MKTELKGRVDRRLLYLYHLNAEEEPENPDYPKNPEFKAKFGPRGVLHSWAKPDGIEFLLLAEQRH